MTGATLPTLHERLPDLAAVLAERGALGVVLIDASSLDEVEEDYGQEARDRVRERLTQAVGEVRERELRQLDNVCQEAPGGLSFVVALGPKRRRNSPVTMADVRQVRQRLLTALGPALPRAVFPYRKSAPKLDVGVAIALHNPLLRPERVLARALEAARRGSAHQREADELAQLDRLHDLIAGERVVTAYQPIVGLVDRQPLGYEALTRGARGSGLEAADELFGTAESHHLLVELDRLCRMRALLNSGKLPTQTKLFVNTLPATIRDPGFRGRTLIDSLEKARVSPHRIVIEITERLVIENYALFQETTAYFTDLGMSFAVDDVGAGYSGLEAIARLKPAYLKIDMGLVRDVHVSQVNREMVKAIVSLGHGIGAKVIGEGIHSEEEAISLVAAGVDYGQGFHLGRPIVAEVQP